MDLVNTIETYSYFARELKLRHPDIAYFAALEARLAAGEDIEAPKEETLDFLVRYSLSSHFRTDLLCCSEQYDIVSPTPFLYGGGFNLDLAHGIVEAKPNSVIQIGRPWTSNVSSNPPCPPSPLNLSL
jgi:NADPH2 dehydrogenase